MHAHLAIIPATFIVRQLPYIIAVYRSKNPVPDMVQTRSRRGTFCREPLIPFITTPPSDNSQVFKATRPKLKSLLNAATRSKHGCSKQGLTRLLST